MLPLSKKSAPTTATIDICYTLDLGHGIYPAHHRANNTH